jgi:hypothetical protein
MDIKIDQYLPLQDPPKFTQIRIFGFKRCHLATPPRAKNRLIIIIGGPRPLAMPTFFQANLICLLQTPFAFGKRNQEKNHETFVVRYIPIAFFLKWRKIFVFKMH